MQGIDPFTPEMKEYIKENMVLSIKCEKCDYETGYIQGITSMNALIKSLKMHMRDNHKGVYLQ